ncbi:hypothetical protein [Streptomyces sp. NBC_00872]|uniref:hypothetical protein n=1 Tax=Streptomyces sp. NBC_00872 TaxID=2903686 RepID=UPI00386DCC53|nr:hypothetical protein OG214_07570 [Streptomyces sp. NBC_00872]
MAGNVCRPQHQLNGSTAAHIGVNPQSSNTDEGKLFDTLSVSDDGAGHLVLSESVQVHKPVVCNWHAADVVTLFLEAFVQPRRFT